MQEVKKCSESSYLKLSDETESMHENLTLQSPSPVIYFLYQAHTFQVSSNNTTDWGSSIQISEPAQDLVIQTTTLSFEELSAKRQGVHLRKVHLNIQVTCSSPLYPTPYFLSLTSQQSAPIYQRTPISNSKKNLFMPKGGKSGCQSTHQCEIDLNANIWETTGIASQVSGLRNIWMC